jgi:cytochrome c peroxidase
MHPIGSDRTRSISRSGRCSSLIPTTAPAPSFHKSCIVTADEGRSFPPAPKLDRFGKLDPEKATPQELRGKELFFAKAKCAECDPAPYYTDNAMHDLRVEEFYQGRAEGWAKTFSLRSIKDSSPYLHDGRLPTLEDTVEFFNLILQTRLTAEEKLDLTAFMQCL